MRTTGWVGGVLWSINIKRPKQLRVRPRTAANPDRRLLIGKRGPDALKPVAESALRKWPVSKRLNRSGEGDDDQTIIEKALPTFSTAALQHREQARLAITLVGAALAGGPMILAQGKQHRLRLVGRRLGAAQRHQIAPQIAAAVDLDEAGQGQGGKPGQRTPL
jgi:hypothetical protein